MKLDYYFILFPSFFLRNFFCFLSFVHMLYSLAIFFILLFYFFSTYFISNFSIPFHIFLIFPFSIILYCPFSYHKCPYFFNKLSSESCVSEKVYLNGCIFHIVFVFYNTIFFYITSFFPVKYAAYNTIQAKTRER